MSWYLFLIATQAYLGPMTEPSCRMAVVPLREYGIVCKQATSSYFCEIPGKPGTGTVCPKFEDLPQVTIKEKAK